MIKWNYENIKKFVKENSKCELISNDAKKSIDKIEFKCECGSTFITTFVSFKDKNKRQCNECGRKIKWLNRKRPTIESIAAYVKENSDSSLLDNNYVDNITKLKLRCSCGNIFLKSWTCIHSKKFIMCKPCINKILTDNQRLDNEVFKKRIQDTHGEKYNICGKYLSANTNILMFCNDCKSEFSIKPSHLFDGHGCPYCKTKSLGEAIIEKYLKTNEIIYKREYTFDDCRGIKRKLPFDFAILNKENKAEYIIEFDGVQHYKKSELFGEKHFDETIINDAIKNSYCEDHNVNLIRIPYWEKKNIKKILNQKITL